jgi:glycerophosphoryl diester phosphodiesterase
MSHRSPLPSLFLSLAAGCGLVAQEAALLHRIDAGSARGLQELFQAGPTVLPFVSAHRGGAAKGWPENCLPTFEETLRRSFAMLEIDPRFARDGVIVVHHDATLERTTTGKGRVADLTLAELRELKLKDAEGNITEFHMPTLDEALAWSRGKTILVLDQKDVPAVERARQVTKHQAEACAMLIVSSFKDVQTVHALNSNIFMEVMIPNRDKVLEFDRLGVPWRNVVAFVGHVPPEDARLYEMIHERGARCMIGTSRNLDRKFLSRQVSDLKSLERDYRAFLQRGADVIETDIPRELVPLLFGSTPIPPSLRSYFHAK